MNSENKICQNCKAEFAIELDDFAFYEKIKVPPPTFCPKCRMQRRMAFRNERKLFRAKSGLSGNPLLSLYPPESGYIIYSEEEWRSDRWNSRDYARDFDPSRPFLAQLRELDRAVPKFSNDVLGMINSPYSANASYLKNCYLLFNSNTSEDSAYGNAVDYCNNCYDNSHIQKSQRCYNSFWLTGCYEAHFSARCEDCRNIWFSKDCRGCSDCVGCVNLRMKKYCIFNKQYFKDEYANKLKELGFHARSRLAEFQTDARAFWKKFPNRFLEGAQNRNVSGEFITNSKNVTESYLIRECENLKYCQYSQVPTSKDCFDVSLFGSGSELLYESSVCGWTGARMRFCYECWDGPHDMEYCMFCMGTSSELFGCVAMKNAKYCILNKQYPKEEYEALVEKIKRHMDEMPYVSEIRNPNGETRKIEYRYGEFFPPEFSPFAYNQSIAQEHIHLTREEALTAGFRWQDPIQTEYQTTIDISTLPDSIHETPDDILKEIIKCETCGKAYRLIAEELQFLKQLGIAAPRTCVDCRHNTRIAERNPALFYPRKCQCGGDYSVPPLAPLSHEDSASIKTSSVAKALEDKSADRSEGRDEGRMGGERYQNTAQHLHGGSPCANKFETSYAPDRPEIVYCEQCYQAEVA